MTELIRFLQNEIFEVAVARADLGDRVRDYIHLIYSDLGTKSSLRINLWKLVGILQWVPIALQKLPRQIFFIKVVSFTSPDIGIRS